VIRIEEMRPEHWPAVARIYGEGLDLGTFEETVPSWEEWDAGHLASPRLVVFDNRAHEGEMLGWAALSPYSRREVYEGVTEDSIYIARDTRGRGVGRALLEELIRLADEQGIWTIQAGILFGNHASVLLHERCGFRHVGVRERIAKKRGEWRDVIVMERRSPLVD
jgi:L-amino acid N-acyltransferase YncA